MGAQQLILEPTMEIVKSPITKEFKIRASCAGEILAGKIGLTDKQQETYISLKCRKDAYNSGEKGVKALTDNMERDLAQLIYKLENPELPQTAKSYCEKWVKEQLYDRRKNFVSKFFDKGNAVEDDSIKYAAKVLGWGAVEKNQEWFSNDFMEGTPDIISEEVFINDLPADGPVIVDMKNSYDCFSFPLFETCIPEDGYEAQLQVYMHLVAEEYGVEINDAILCYTLMDAPLDVREKEMRALSWREGHMGLITDEIRQTVNREMIYSNMPDSLRVKTFHIKRNPAVIEELERRVEMCRKYINTLIA